MNIEQEIIWLAGLLEGEGYFQVCSVRGTATVIRIRLQMTDEDVVRHAARIMGAPSVRVRKRNNPKWKDLYVTEVQCYRAESIMRQILPFMGARRKSRIEESLFRWERRLTLSKAAHSRANKRKDKFTKSLFMVGAA